MPTDLWRFLHEQFVTRMDLTVEDKYRVALEAIDCMLSYLDYKSQTEINERLHDSLRGQGFFKE